ncbi:hypothetical protein C8R43DRAFT_1050832 [Mycena crocata]|nr:hypothetical protein C8R43DRAFT_1050832 [Mycena crocata]
MRFTLPALMLAFVVAVGAQDPEQCAVCRTTIPPGPPEISWTLVFNDVIAEDVTFCGYHGHSSRNPNNTATTFCEYTTSTGARIDNEFAWSFCPRTVVLEDC